MKVKNLIGYNGNEVVNQIVIEDNGNTYFQSYSSLVVKAEGSKITLGPDWNYSKTTMKYVKLFLEDYCGLADMCKKNIEKEIKAGNFIVDGDM